MAEYGIAIARIAAAGENPIATMISHAHTSSWIDRKRAKTDLIDNIPTTRTTKDLKRVPEANIPKGKANNTAKDSPDAAYPIVVPVASIAIFRNSAERSSDQMADTISTMNIQAFGRISSPSDQLADMILVNMPRTITIVRNFVTFKRNNGYRTQVPISSISYNSLIIPSVTSWQSKSKTWIPLRKPISLVKFFLTKSMECKLVTKVFPV